MTCDTDRRSADGECPVAIRDILRALTPERLEGLIHELAANRDPAERAGVDVSSIMARLLIGHDLGVGEERGRAYERLRRAIQDTVARIDGLQYVKSSD